MAGGQRHNLLTPVGEKLVAADDERTDSEFDKGPEGFIDLTHRARSQDMQFQTERRRCVPQVSCFGFGIRGVGRIDQHSDDGCCGQ